MEIRHLRYFVAVAEELNFRRAAERLHVSQPPLTKQIQALEALVGAQLFDRNKQRVVLTAAGQELLIHARAMLQGLALAKANVAEAARGARGELRIGYTESAIHVELLLRALDRVRIERPQVRLSLLPMKSMLQLAALESQELDIGFVWAIPERTSSSLRFEPVWSDHLVVALPRAHPLARRKRDVSLGDLHDEPFVALSRDGGTLLFRTTVRACRAYDFVPLVAREAQDLAGLISLVAAGAGVALVPASMTCFQAPGVCYLSLQTLIEPLQLYWVSRNDEISPLVATFRAGLDAEAAVLRTLPAD